MTSSRGLTLLVLLSLPTAPAVAQLAVTSCTVCHSDPEVFDEEDIRIVEAWKEGVHATVGLSCHDCHGGNPDPRLSDADDADVAMDPDYAANPFRGTPEKVEIPEFCGRCHSDPEFMKRFRPDIRVDQEREYWTSFHGRALRGGDERVAACVDCHGGHGIQRIDDPESPVYPTHVATTCGTCHADPDRMAGTTLDDGRPIPVDQVARWRQSVHGRALMDKGDHFAPTCNDCHGNHGATPPGVESVTFVCGQCHAREAELMRGSPKYTGFAEHNDYLDDEGVDGCASCHEPPEPQAALVGLTKLGQCTTCHDNHLIVRPTTAHFADLPETPCAFCHGRSDAVSDAIVEPLKKVAKFEQQRDALLAEVDQLNLEGLERYDWLVEQTLELPSHTRVVTEGGTDRRVLRSEFGRLFDKFRVGRAHYEYTDPATGEARSVRIRRCSDCHSADPEIVDDPKGRSVAHAMIDRLQGLETLIAQAERILLSAKRGGVEVGEAQAELDQAVDSQIQLQALVHSFSVDEGSPFLVAHAEGTEHATTALEASQEALKELEGRRRWLSVILVFIVLVLIGLAMLIRDYSQRGASEASADLPGRVRPTP